MNMSRPSCRKFIFTAISMTHGIKSKTSQCLPDLVGHPTKPILYDNLEYDRYAVQIEPVYEQLCEGSAFDHIHFWADLCNQFKVSERLSINPYGLGHKGTSGGAALRSLLTSVENQLIVSARQGQLSCAGPEGPIFTNALFKSIDGVINSGSNANFDQVFDQVKMLTQQETSDRKFKNKQCFMQTPLLYRTACGQ